MFLFFQMAYSLGERKVDGYVDVGFDGRICSWEADFLCAQEVCLGVLGKQACMILYKC